MRLGAMKYVRPFAYMGTKLIANAIYGSMTSRMPSIPRILDLTRHQVAATQKLRNAQTRSLRAEPRRVEKLAEWTPVFNHAPDRPAAVKRNGGLRGSTASRWR